MIRMIAALTLAGALFAVVAPGTAAARGVVTCSVKLGCSDRPQAGRHNTHRRQYRHQAAISARDPRPARWCAWWLRRDLHIPRSAFRPGEWNLARAFRYIGRRAHGAAVGVIVVWRHHVGIITGRRGHRWVVKSGNDGHRVRERARALRGVIAFRWPPNSAWASR